MMNILVKKASVGAGAVFPKFRSCHTWNLKAAVSNLLSEEHTLPLSYSRNSSRGGNCFFPSTVSTEHAVLLISFMVCSEVDSKSLSFFFNWKRTFLFHV